MRRHALAIHFARRRLDPQLIKLQSTPVKKWPEHLKLAFELLQKKSALTDRKICSIIIESVRAAHACAKAINLQSDRFVKFKTRGKLRKSFKLIANCAKRAPLNLRRRLNEGIVPLIRENPVDIEVIEAILTTAVAAFLEFPEEEAARTALRLRSNIPMAFDCAAALKNEYSALDDAYQRKVENAIREIAKASNNKTIASDVFRVLASALNSKKSESVSSEIHALIVDYVATVADLWRSAGLRPSRVWHETTPTYIGRFHCFVDIVLTAVTEPWSRRHLISPDDIRQRARMAHSRLSPPLRAMVRSPLSRTDISYLVSDDHVKKALRKRFKK